MTSQQPQRSQQERGEAFRALHQRDGLFVLPNPWDAGSAKMLAHLGFEALATTSAGLAFALGRPDAEGAVSRDEALANARAIVEATPLPVAADLENGYGDAPEDCAQTIRLAAACGLVGGSIEDASGRADAPIYPLELAVERVAAAVQAARALPFTFTLAARAENFLHGRADLDDTIRRLVAFAEAGADVLYAPGLKTREEIAAVVQAVAPRPVNVLVGSPAVQLGLDELAELGVKRVSVGSTLARAAYGAFFSASQALAKGDLKPMHGAMPFDQLNGLFRG
ncbi:isocitrate lyase/PEP mutase family protein [Pseudomonas sp. Pseusp97]|uniref:isocitrate lyase/PEP mutase family protein n=1 Tax=Pseudomonas sp. Pseusp97 TaxID=3243065 RepID=UPI0039A76F22